MGVVFLAIGYSGKVNFQCNSVNRLPQMQRVKGERRPSGKPSYWGGSRALFTISARSWAPLKQVMPIKRLQQGPLCYEIKKKHFLKTNIPCLPVHFNY